jgi:hypothetical protein
MYNLNYKLKSNPQKWEVKECATTQDAVKFAAEIWSTLFFATIENKSTGKAHRIYPAQKF